MSNWDEGMSLADSFDNPESCECALVFDFDGCRFCGHDLACMDAFCTHWAHIKRLAGRCDCLLREELDECENCYHDLECTESACKSETHERVKSYGNPKFCSCQSGMSKPDCPNCGHTIECLEDECSGCFQDEHTGRYVYFKYVDDCECSSFEEPITCDSCSHDLNCPENHGFCLLHLKVEPQAQASDGIESDNQAPKPQQDSQHAGNLLGPIKAGAYWTRAEDETLVGSYLAGASDGEMGELLGRSVNAIRLRLIKVCFEANGIQINQDLSRSQESKIEWVESEDSLLEGLVSKNVELPLISQALKRSELSVAFRLVAKRIARPGDLNLIAYRTPKGKNSMGQVSRWTNAQYVTLREHFRNGDSIENLAAKLGRSELSCFAVLYARGEITNAELNLALETAVSTLDYLKKM